MSNTKQTERLTPALSETLLTLLETLPGALFVVDDAATIVYANASAQTLTGATREELLGTFLLRQWTSFIYTWLTQSHFDPTHSGRVTMDHLMKLVTTALEWTYEAHETDVRAETLEQAAELLVLRRDTFRIIDGDGLSHDVLPAESASGTLASETKKDQEELDQNERVGSPEVQKAVPQPTKPVKCTFSGVVPIDLQLFLNSGVPLVECPDCTSTSSLSPHNGILRFKSHNRRKTRSLSTEPRWAKREMNWGVVSK